MAPKPKVVPRLVIIEGKDKGKIIPLSDGTVVIGRTKGDVVIQDSRVSRSHVAIHFESKSGKLTFTDLKSLNGTLLNGDTQETGVLNDGDSLALGNTVFDCQIGAPVDEESSVSKVRDQMRKRRENGDEKKKKEVRQIREPSMPLVAESQEKEPKAVRSSDEGAAEPTRGFQITKLMGRQKKRKRSQGSPFLRRVAMLIVVLGGAALFFMDSGPVENAQLKEAIEEVKTLATSGKFSKAIERANVVKKDFPDYSQPHMLLGLLHALTKRNQEAITHYLAAKNRNPMQPLVHGRLIELYIKTGLKDRIPDEVNEIDELIRTGQHSKELFVETGRLLIKYKDAIGKPAADYIIIGKALQREFAPASALGFQLEAEGLLANKKTDEAIFVLEKLLQRFPSDAFSLEKLSFAKLSKNDFKGAKETLNSWIKINPKATKALLVLAYLGFNESPEGALPFLQKIMENAQTNPQDPLLPEAVYLMGQVFYRQKQIPQATQMFSQACKGGYQPACKLETALKQKGSTDAPKIPPQPKATAAAPSQNGADAGAVPPPKN